MAQVVPEGQDIPLKVYDMWKFPSVDDRVWRILLDFCKTTEATLRLRVLCASSRRFWPEGPIKEDHDHRYCMTPEDYRKNRASSSPLSLHRDRDGST